MIIHALQSSISAIRARLMSMDPFKWMEIGKDERAQPLGNAQWGHSFWKMTAIVMAFLWLCTIAYNEGKSISVGTVRAVVAAEVAGQLDSKLMPLMDALTKIQKDDERRDKILESLSQQKMQKKKTP